MVVEQMAQKQTIFHVQDSKHSKLVNKYHLGIIITYQYSSGIDRDRADSHILYSFGLPSFPGYTSFASFVIFLWRHFRREEQF